MKQILYIAGTSYSGSTLLSFLVNAHPEIVSVGEVTGPIQKENRHEYPCSCGEPIGRCSFWTAAGEEMERRGLRFDPDHWEMDHIIGRGSRMQQLLTGSLGNGALERLRDALVWNVSPWTGAMRRRARRVQGLMDSITERTGIRILGDASKNPFRIPLLTRLTGYEIKVIYLVRDPRGFVYSNIKNHGGVPTVAESARVWNRISERAERMRSRLPDDAFLMIRYEDLCEDLPREMKRITNLLGADPIAQPIQFKEAEHHIIGNRMRLSSGNEVKLNELWRETLTAEQVVEIERLTFEYRGRYGY